MQDSGRVEADCKALLADHLQYIRDQRGRKDLEEKGVFFSGPVVRSLAVHCWTCRTPWGVFEPSLPLSPICSSAQIYASFFNAAGNQGL